jgi:FdhD protein
VFAVRRDGDARPRRFEDRVVVEEPLEVRLDGATVTTTMRTPGADFELAVGFLWSEGALDGAGGVVDVRYCELGDAFESGFNVVSVATRSGAARARPRLSVMTAACGVCGSDALDALCERLSPLPAPVPPLPPEVVVRVDAAMRRQQPVFDETGAAHAAAAFDLPSGDVVVVREDIGRHNAVDKVVGRLVLDDRVPVDHDDDVGLFVSGRASFEMVQKAWAAGFRWLLAVGGPSSLAVDTARRANLGLAAFARAGATTVYSPEDRP